MVLVSLAVQAQTVGSDASKHDITPPELPVVASSAKITLEQAVQIAFKENAQIKASQFQVQAAAANLTGQRAPLNPMFNYGGLNNSVAPFPTLNVNDPSNYGVTLTVETNGANQWRTSQASNQLRQARADALTASLNIRQAVTNAYVALQVANRGLEDEREAYADTLRIRDLTQKQFEAGSAPQTNAIRAEIALTQEAGNLLTQINAVKSARTNLNIALGRKPGEPIDSVETLDFNSIHPNVDELQTQATKMRPELRSAEYSRDALKASVGLQRSQYYPDLMLGTDLRIVRTGVILIGFTMPLFDFGSIHGAVKQAKKNVSAQEAQITLEQQQVRQDVESAYEALTVSQGTVEAYQSGLVPQAEALEKRIEKGYVLGGNTILDLLDAQSTLRAARIAYYGAIGNYRQALAQLERAVGTPITALKTAPNMTPDAVGQRKS